MKADPVAFSEHRPRPSRKEAEAAVRTLLRWIGEDPERPGLLGTPGRVTRAYEEWFGGYGRDPAEVPRTTFDETGGYDEVVLLRDVGFVSHCEHHLAPIVGRAHLAYLPDRRVVGISKLARVVDVFAGERRSGWLRLSGVWHIRSDWFTGAALPGRSLGEF